MRIYDVKVVRYVCDGFRRNIHKYLYSTFADGYRPRNYLIAQEVAAENAVVATQSYEGQQVEQVDDKVAVEDPKSSASSVRVLAV
jgi:hypothetical protein